MIPYQLTKIQAPSSNITDKFKMSKFLKGHSSEKLTEFIHKLIPLSTHHPLSADQVSSS